MVFLNEVTSLNKDFIMYLVTRSLYLKSVAKKQNIYNYFPKTNHFAALIFLEPSLRTLTSFQIALKTVKIHFTVFSKANSMEIKSEDLLDHILNLKALGYQTFIIRSKDNNYFEEIKSAFPMNFINAGKGTKAHPTQCLLDLTTIYEHFSYFNNLQVMFIGDTKHSRVFHENVVVFQKLGMKVVVSSPKLFLENEWKDHFVTIEEGLQESDVIYILRNQYERHDGNKLAFFKEFTFNKDHYNALKNNAIVLHPSPVNWDKDIASDLRLNHSKMKILEQVINGKFLRIAVLEAILKKIHLQ